MDFLQLIQQVINRNYVAKTSSENESLAQQVYVLYEGAIAESNLHGKSWPIKAAKSLCNQILT